MKIMVTTCVNDELCHLKEKDEEGEKVGQIMSLGDSRIKRVRNHIAFKAC